MYKFNIFDKIPVCKYNKNKQNNALSQNCYANLLDVCDYVFLLLHLTTFKIFLLFLAELKFCYLKKPYFVTMSTYQMAILLLFQAADSQSYNEIQESTKLNDEQLVKQVQSLVESKLLLTDNVSHFLCVILFHYSRAPIIRRSRDLG